MITSTFDAEAMLSSLAQFDQAVVASANNLKANFDAQLAGISKAFTQTAAIATIAFDATAITVGTSFANTILAINAMFDESTLMLPGLFGAAFTAIDTSIRMSATNFALMFGTSALMITEQFNAVFAAINIAATTSSLLVSTSLIAALTMMSAGILAFQAMTTLSCVGIETTFVVTFSNIVLAFTACLLLMNAALIVGFAGITVLSLASAAVITSGMIGAFALISIGLVAMGLVATDVLATIKTGFTLTAEHAKSVIAEAMNNITQNLAIIGNVSVETTSKSKSGWVDCFDSLTSFSGTLADAVTIVSGAISIFQALKGAQAATTAILSVNTGVQITNTAATAAAGATASAAALSFLAFGGGVLALGAGLLLAATAFALMAKVAFNALKLLGMKTNGVKASDFDLSFSIPGLATGGFPSLGQMFVAREAGPELVGTIGSRNAVVNNNQIVESVSAGVYRAVRDALAGQGGGGTLQLIMDGTKVAEVVANNVNRITKRTGQCPILV